MTIRVQPDEVTLGSTRVGLENRIQPDIKLGLCLPLGQAANMENVYLKAYIPNEDENQGM